jgi:hypothetical protein
MGSWSSMQSSPPSSHTGCVVVHACSLVLHPVPCNPNVQSNSEGLDLVVEAIAKAGYTGKVVIGMDVAASEFYTADKVGHGNTRFVCLTRDCPLLSRCLHGGEVKGGEPVHRTPSFPHKLDTFESIV